MVRRRASTTPASATPPLHCSPRTTVDTWTCGPDPPVRTEQIPFAPKLRSLSLPRWTNRTSTNRRQEGKLSEHSVATDRRHTTNRAKTQKTNTQTQHTGCSVLKPLISSHLNSFRSYSSSQRRRLLLLMTPPDPVDLSLSCAINLTT